MTKTTAPASAQPRPRAVPRPTPETALYWEGTAAEELWLRHCAPCDAAYFYPRDVCPRCGSVEVTWIRASGRGSLHTYVIEHRAAPGFEADVPYVVAIVELEEGPRMMSMIVGVDPDPDKLPLDLPLQVAFEDRGAQKVPVFTPREDLA